MTFTFDSPIGPVTFRNVRLGIFDDQDPTLYTGCDAPGEIFLGSPFLKHLGLDAEDQLDAAFIRTGKHNFDLEEANPVEDGRPVGGLATYLSVLKLKEEESTNQFTADDDFIPYSQIDLDKTISEFRERNQLDGDDIENGGFEVGSHDQETVNTAIEGMLEEAYKCLPEPCFKRLSTMIDKYRDLFRLQLGNDPPAAVSPLTVEFKGTPRPVKVRQRTYPPAQREFLTQETSELLRHGCIYLNANNEWAVAPHCERKPSSKKGFRLYFDYRPLNPQLKKMVWPVPQATAELAKFSGATHFAKFDFIGAYWQMPLAKEAQECHSFHTPDDVNTPLRVPHGTVNAVPYFQGTMTHLFNRLSVLIWLNDVLAHSKSSWGLLSTIESFFNIFHKHGLKLDPRKCKLAQNSTSFCGRSITPEGVQF